jgi:hypothetical protein
MPREPSKEDRDDLKVGKAIEEMLATPGWKIYEKILSTKIDEKIRAALSPLAPVVQPDNTVILPDGVTHVLLGEAAKGAIIGLRLALDLPRGIVHQTQALRHELFPGSANDE